MTDGRGIKYTVPITPLLQSITSVTSMLSAECLVLLYPISQNSKVSQHPPLITPAGGITLVG